MRTLTNKAIAKIFREFADKIENNTCDTDVETLTDVANKLIHIKLNVDQMCKYIRVSRATLIRMAWDGRIPKPKREAGGKEYWYQDEVDEHIAEYKRKNGIA